MLTLHYKANNYQLNSAYTYHKEFHINRLQNIFAAKMDLQKTKTI